MGGSCFLFTCFVVNRNDLNSADWNFYYEDFYAKMILHSINAGQKGAKQLLDWYLLKTQMCPGLDVILIRCCLEYDFKLSWRRLGNDTKSCCNLRRCG